MDAVMSEQLSLLPAPAPPPAVVAAPPPVDPESLAALARFDEFWVAYPRKKARGYARRCWATAIKKADPDTIIAAVRRYPFSPDPSYRPHASTWLNGEAWLDVAPDLSADPWGLDEFLASLPDGEALSALSYERDAVERVMLATGWPTEWRGSLDVLNAWLRDGYTPSSIADAIQAEAARKTGRQSLAWFDGVVRMRATQLDRDSFGYR